MSTVSLKLNRTDLVSENSLSLFNFGFCIQRVSPNSGSSVFLVPVAGVNWGKEHEPGLSDRMYLREQVPAESESCPVRREGGNPKPGSWTSFPSSHQKGSSTGRISTSSSEP